jgi:hypothetical protein
MICPYLTTSHVPNLTLYVPNLTGVPNVPKIEQCQVYCMMFEPKMRLITLRMLIVLTPWPIDSSKGLWWKEYIEPFEPGIIITHHVV